ncbi:MAG: protein-L-isoaspartate(D-aspartate) O-methyltransferase [Spirochaetaceae bacterium]|nr:MAG: protein-L-isoaspartate(D-aspartate) O-methyltransferase [Spirochaetaceae bacterium]
MKLGYLRDQGITSPRVIAAIEAVPRDRFVPDESRAAAYDNRPLPIGRGQTISQPYIVAYMTQELDLRSSDRVLEIGTGSGYQTAILAELCAEVYSVEILPSLAERARALLDELGYQRVRTRVGNGRHGWSDYAPFDAVIVTAAADTVPLPLVEQLADGGRMVIPVGPDGGPQELQMVRKSAAGVVSTSPLLPVRFVPLTGAGS